MIEESSTPPLSVGCGQEELLLKDKEGAVLHGLTWPAWPSLARLARLAAWPA